MQNEAQYDLDRLAAKISALSSNNLDKYEYLIGEDLGYKPSVVEQARFDYSQLEKVFTKGLDKENKEEGLFKRLKNIEDKIESKNEEQPEPIKNQSDTDDKNPKKIVLLKDELDIIFENFGLNFNTNEKKFLEKLAKDEKRLITIICFSKQMISLLLKVLIF